MWWWDSREKRIVKRMVVACRKQEKKKTRYWERVKTPSLSVCLLVCRPHPSAQICSNEFRNAEEKSQLELQIRRPHSQAPLENKRWIFCSADGFSSSADGCCANAGISRAGVASKMENPRQQQKRNSQQIQKNRVSSRRGKQKRENSKEDRRGSGGEQSNRWPLPVTCKS